MDFEGWGMRVTVIRREYATHEISTGVFGNRRASGGYASGGVAWLKEPGTSRATIGGGISQAISELSWRGQPPMQSQRRSTPSPFAGKPRLGRPVPARSPHRANDAVRPAHRLARNAIRAAVRAR
ncbi:MAG: hypothetical protein QOG95_802 [Mycobacterium sp.]|jgi:hypothetical protein|nr:hypothetical protein [Mycobacterium sp.]